MLFYCTKIDKNGNKLTSSYTSRAGADKYGKGSTIKEALYRADFESNPGGVRLRQDSYDGPLVRGILENNGTVEKASKGRYVLWGKQNNVWSETLFHFPSYSSANTAMKSLISEYQTLLILDTESGDVANLEKVREESVSLETEL